MKASLIRFGLAAACVTAARADFNPVPVTPGSFTQDIVVEKGATPPPSSYANVDMDSGTNCNGKAWFESGFMQNLPWLGLPPHGTTFISHNDTNHVWLMPPDYTTNCVAYVGSAGVPGTSPTLIGTQVVSAVLNVVTPISGQSQLSILWSSGGAGAVNYAIHFASNPDQGGNVYASAVGANTGATLDWFNGTTAFEYIASGSIQIGGQGTGVMQSIGSTTVQKLYRTDINLNYVSDMVTGITFTYPTTGNNNYRFMAFGLSESPDNIHYSPVQVSGFNRDGVVESNVWFKAANVNGYGVTMDQGPQGGGNTFYEQGFASVNVGSTPTIAGATFCTTNFSAGGVSVFVTNVTSGAPYSGLPHPGAMLSGIQDTNHTFMMPTNYAMNNCVFIGNYAAFASTNIYLSNSFFSGFLTNLGLYSSTTYGATAPNYRTGGFNILNPTAGYNRLSIFGSVGNGPLTIAYTNNYIDGSTDGGTFQLFDWFFNGGTITNRVWNTSGRVGVGGGTGYNNVNGNPAGAVWYADVSVNPANTLTNITFYYVSGGRGPLFGLSAATDGAHFSPIAVSGYDADIIVEQSQPGWPAALFTFTTATMDNGVNNFANTWYERGWVTNGVGANSGLPAAGSTINSLSDPSKHYTMPASWAGNNAVLVDSAHTNAIITPVTPAIYSAFSMLTAGGNQTGNLLSTNLCIMLYQDGSAETNVFYGLDWFNNNGNAQLPGNGNTVALAYIANGRTDNRGGAPQNLAGLSNAVSGVTQDPRLFETFFVLHHLSSPVTNIQVVYINAPAGHGAATTDVIAMSASKDSFLLQTLASPVSTNQDGAFTMYEGSGVSMWTATAGIPPTSETWQYSPDFGTTWTTINNGGGVTGATTTNITFASMTYANSGQYRMIGCNANGCFTNNLIATLYVYSTLPDVTRPSDPISVYQPNGGSSPGNEQVWEAIANHVGVDAGGTPKYLNYGMNGAAGSPPFVGPIGLVVSPQVGKTVLSALRVYTGNDNAGIRDPINYTLEGSNDGGNTWATISSGPLNLTLSRNANNPSAAPNPLLQALQEVHFTSLSAYFTYRLSFANTANDTVANSIQVGQVELLGVVATGCPTIAVSPPPSVSVVVGSSPSFSITAFGGPSPTYQWQRNGGTGYTNIPGATAAKYTLPNAQLSDSGSLFQCIADNGCGTPATSGSASLMVSAAPTQPYPTNVLHDAPIAWFRLDEGPDDGTGGGNNGVTAFDKWGGHNGYYTNAILQKPGYNSGDPDTAAYFGASGGSPIGLSGQPDSAVEAILGIDFAQPAGSNAQFSVECWMQGDPTLGYGGVIPGAGIVSKGYGGGEQFCLDSGGPGANGFANTFRFFVRNAGSETPAVTSVSGIGPEPGVWHHLVGVCNEAAGTVLLYVDGVPQGAPAAIAAGSGLFDTAQPVTLAARSASAGTNNNLTTFGTLDEVAIYNYALSQTQVQNHYYSVTNLAPLLQLGQNLASNSVVFAGNNITLGPAGFLGTPPLYYQWYLNGVAIPGATNTTYAILNAGTNRQGDYSVRACQCVPCDSNCVNSAVSGTNHLTVKTVLDFNIAGAGWVLNQNDANTIGARGFDNSVPNAGLTLTDNRGGEALDVMYSSQVYINAFLANFTYTDAAGAGASADGVALVLHNDPRGTAAIGGGGGALAISGITPSVEFELNVYTPYTVGFQFGINGATGSTGNSYITPGTINLQSGDPINFGLLYNGRTLFIGVTDTVSHVTFLASTNVNIPALVGGTNTAWIGWAGATGGAQSTQVISNFTYVPIPTMQVSHNPDGTVTISWPAIIGGYTLLESPGLEPATWTTSSATVSVVGNNNQATITPSPTAKFYRLNNPFIP